MKIAPVKCKNTDPYVQRPLAGPFVWYVYNKTTGYIVAATYDKSMAEAILAGIDITNIYQDDYGICEMWKPPEPMIG